MQNDQARQLRLLAQYAAERIDALLSHKVPPYSLGDMDTWRLDRPEYLLEVIDGVLANLELREQWPQWQRFRKDVLFFALPAWERGWGAWEVSSLRREGIEALDPSQTGMTLARKTYPTKMTMQMWFYEGWLAAREERESTEERKGGDQ